MKFFDRILFNSGLLIMHVPLHALHDGPSSLLSLLAAVDSDTILNSLPLILTSPYLLSVIHEVLPTLLSKAHDIAAIHTQGFCLHSGSCSSSFGLL